MTNLELHLRVVGALLTFLGLAHAGFSRYFGWKEELAGVPPLTRQVFFVHNAYIGLTVFLQGLLCFLLPDQLTRPSPLAFALTIGLGLFWASRLVVQFFVYSPTLWRGKAFETAVHVAFVLLWLYVSGVFLACAWSLVARRPH